MKHAWDAGLRAQLARVAQERIFFGHQSVGMNLLDGLAQLAVAAGVPVRIALAPSAGSVALATLGHCFLAANRDPLGKMQAFERTLGTQPAGLDIALLKFCYLDFTADTNAKALFAHYRSMIERLRARHPGTLFVHVTTPLTGVQGGVKARLKRLRGRAPHGILENLRREEYNALLREAYQGREQIFDLAHIESTAADGQAVTVKWKGRVAPAMAPEHSDDGGHLNAVCRLRAARELIAVLARVPAR